LNIQPALNIVRAILYYIASERQPVHQNDDTPKSPGIAAPLDDRSGLWEFLPCRVQPKTKPESRPLWDNKFNDPPIPRGSLPAEPFRKVRRPNDDTTYNHTPSLGNGNAMTSARRNPRRETSPSSRPVITQHARRPQQRRQETMSKDLKQSKKRVRDFLAVFSHLLMV